MKLYLERIATLLPDWNIREQTEDDFFAFCEAAGIDTEIERMRIRGVHSRAMGRDKISISDQLGTLQRLFVMFHEVGHFIMHAPGRESHANFSGYGDPREEQEANAFACCALVPLSMLKLRPGEELAEIYGIRFFMKRLEVYERYGI